MRETADGLEIEARLAINTDAGREAFELAKTGALAFSVGALVVDSEETDDGRLLKAADLLELSLVTVPA
jgi:HK97 family phage prohead protease